jgi:riboflavin biosynthesis pyrimidine reductase
MEDYHIEKPFPTEKIKLTPIYRDEDRLAEIEAASPDKAVPEKIRDVYGEVRFPAAPEDRPYTFSSIVVSVDGKIAYEDDPQGPVVASKNLRDPDGGLADFWVLNMLRFFADAVVVGAKTMQTEPTMTARCFDPELAKRRVPEYGKKSECPAHIIVSFDGTDVPLEHTVFDVPAPVLIATSPEGAKYVKDHIKHDFTDLGDLGGKDAAEAAKTFGKSESGLFLAVSGSGSTPYAPDLLRFLRQSGVGRLLIESPSYMTHLMSLASMDEMFMNYSSAFVGGKIGFGAYQSFHSDNHPHSDFLQINLHKKNFLYTRQKMVYEGYDVEGL